MVDVIRQRLARLLPRLLTPFGLGALACLLLAGWALWTGGLLDGPVASQVRTSSVYAAPAIDLDRAEAERVIGNRRLVVLLLDDPGIDLASGCDQVRRAAAGTLVLVLRPETDGYDRYGCALVSDPEDSLGRRAVAETTIANGVDSFPDRPLDAIKVAVLNYDLLVRAGTIPDGGRTISPSLPRYLIASAALLAVVIGTAVAYGGALRAGRLTARHLARREATADRRGDLSAAVGVLADQILELDRRYGRPGQPRHEEYRRLAAEYVTLLETVDERPDGPDLDRLTARVSALTTRARELVDSG